MHVLVCVCLCMRACVSVLVCCVRDCVDCVFVDCVCVKYFCVWLYVHVCCACMVRM